MYRRGRHRLGRGGGRRDPAALDEDDPVGVVDDAFEPVLGEDDGVAEVVDESSEGGEDLLGGHRVQGRGRLVEHEHPGTGREDRPDRHALLLTTGQGGQRSVAQVRQADEVEGLLESSAHG